MLSTFPPASSSQSIHSFDTSSVTSAARQSYLTTTTTMDSRDSQSTSFGSYNGTSTQAHSLPYDGQDGNGTVASRQHYAPTGQYDTTTDAATAAAARQYTQAPTYLARPYPTDPRYAVTAADHARVPANGYATDPSVALAGYQGYPPGAATAAWRAEWYPPVSSAFPPHAIPVGAGPPMGTLGVPRAGDNRMRRGGRVGEFPGNTVYSFVPLPGAAQQKRPRRRYEEIERIYKCGWQGCEKAYGTLNHLNAHVTMQNHGPKRTPEEFKETRKEWKARKKEEESRRKAEADARGQQQQQQQQQQPQQQQQTTATSGAPGQPGQQLAPAQQAARQSAPMPLHPQSYPYPDPYGQYQ